MLYSNNKRSNLMEGRYTCAIESSIRCNKSMVTYLLNSIKNKLLTLVFWNPTNAFIPGPTAYPIEFMTGTSYGA